MLRFPLELPPVVKPRKRHIVRTYFFGVVGVFFRLDGIDISFRVTGGTQMNKHPEQRDDELYMGNTRPEEVWKSSWRTSRLGENPLKADGSPYTGDDLKPWFIQRSEVEAAIETEKLVNKPWSAEKIRVFESMLAESAA